MGAEGRKANFNSLILEIDGTISFICPTVQENDVKKQPPSRSQVGNFWDYPHN